MDKKVKDHLHSAADSLHMIAIFLEDHVEDDPSLTYVELLRVEGMIASVGHTVSKIRRLDEITIAHDKLMGRVDL